MIVYNVTVSIAPEIETSWLDWMKKEHIPDVMNTGLFLQGVIHKVLSDQNECTYAIQYSCNNLSDYQLYKTKFAEKLQKEHSKKFEGKFVAFRTILKVVHTHE